MACLIPVLFSITMILDFIMFLGTVVAEPVADAVSSVTLVEKLSGTTPEALLHFVTAFSVSLVGKFIKILLIWVVGRWFLHRVVKLIKLLMDKHNVTPSVNTFVSSVVDVIAKAIIIIMIVGVLGIDTSSLIALFASAGVAIGMALSGTLQNFAGGVMILLFRPFKVGDFIEAQGVSGTVKEIQIFNTLVYTGDNKVILLPNGPVSTGIINNYSREPRRRLDLTYSIAYGDDFGKAKEVLMRLINEDDRILDAPASPLVELGVLGASSIDITVRVWCRQQDYSGILFDLNRKVYETFPKEGLNFPYQTFTLHVEKDA